MNTADELSQQKEQPEKAIKETSQDIPREISILHRNLRLLKRIVFGKKKPPLFMRIVAVVAILWSLLLIMALLGVLFLMFFSPEVQVVADLKTIDTKFYISYAGLHFVTIISILLMWRGIIFGFYLFILTNLLMPFWISFFLPVFSFNYYFLIPSGVFILLFGIYFKVQKAREKRKFEEEK